MSLKRPFEQLGYAVRDCFWLVTAELMALLRLRGLEQTAREQMTDEVGNR